MIVSGTLGADSGRAEKDSLMRIDNVSSRTRLMVLSHLLHGSAKVNRSLLSKLLLVTRSVACPEAMKPSILVKSHFAGIRHEAPKINVKLSAVSSNMTPKIAEFIHGAQKKGRKKGRREARQNWLARLLKGLGESLAEESDQCGR